MNVLGKVGLEKAATGSLKIEPVLFVVTNWEVLCDLVQVEPRPGLHVYQGLKPETFGGGDTSAMFIEESGATARVCVNVTDLQQDSTNFTISGLNPIGLLWGMPASMLRSLLYHRKILLEEDRLGPKFVRSVGFPVDLLLPHVGYPEGSDQFKRRFDALLIQSAVQKYMQELSLEDEVDWVRVKNLILARRSTADVKHFWW
jgi:hypothetical protein